MARAGSYQNGSARRRSRRCGWSERSCARPRTCLHDHIWHIWRASKKQIPSREASSSISSKILKAPRTYKAKRRRPPLPHPPPHYIARPVPHSVRVTGSISHRTYIKVALQMHALFASYRVHAIHGSHVFQALSRMHRAIHIGPRHAENPFHRGL